MVATIFLPNDPTPVIADAGIEPDICEEKNRDVILSVQGSAPFTYSSYDETGRFLSQSADLSGQHAGSYYATITDANYRSARSPLYVIKDSSLLITAPVYADQILLKGSAATLNPAMIAQTFNIFIIIFSVN